MKWTVSDPFFECDAYNPELQFAYWEGHRNFAYDMTAYMRPTNIVELGSQYGCSLFSFCQAVKDLCLDTHVSAVDKWSGDVGAALPGEEVYRLVKAIAGEAYADVKLSLYQMSFDDALTFFPNESIDILHIDGGHTFEDVDRDFNHYLPKLKNRGVILFHDIYSTIDSGSCEHWTMIKQRYHNWFEFRHSMGLGILFPKKSDWYWQMSGLDFVEKYIPLYTFKAEKSYYFNRLEQLKRLYEERYEALQQQSEMIRQRDVTIAHHALMLEERLQALNEQDKKIQEMEHYLKPFKGIYHLCKKLQKRFKYKR